MRDSRANKISKNLNLQDKGKGGDGYDEQPARAALKKPKSTHSVVLTRRMTTRVSHGGAEKRDEQ